MKDLAIRIDAFYISHKVSINNYSVGNMELYNPITNMQTMRTFSDSLGNQYELRGQKGMCDNQGCFETNYYELHKKEAGSDTFKKVGAKEEAYISTYEGYKPCFIKRETFSDEGELLEKSKVSKTVGGSNIECKGKFLNMDGELRIIRNEVHRTDLPKQISINSLESATNFAKRAIKQLGKLK